MTTPILFKEYIWLVNTIYQARSITLEVCSSLYSIRAFSSLCHS